jgi:hypothetical protein
MRKITLEEKDIKEFEQMVNNLPCFAKNVAENMAVSQAVNSLIQFMGSKIQESDSDIKSDVVENHLITND